jgi:murein DD-endopeptidase MepM/ murein hydrolase activator NlpD
MKKYYYFSEKSLEFVEIKNFKTRFLFYLSLVSIFFSVIVFSGFFLLSSFTSSRVDLSSIKKENTFLKGKLIDLTKQFRSFKENLEDLDNKTENLRIAANLEPISEDEKLLGVGGGSFDNTFDFLKSSSESELDNALNFIENLTSKFEFEKSQYEEISNKMKLNEKLFESIPAIMPTKGLYISTKFGMRMHPILKIWRRHPGIDFVANIGTPVYATGMGKVIYVGRRGGYGLEVEIDHGFGYKTRYAHLSKSLVKKGQLVNRGDLIAKTGNSGLSTGPHLHYEVSHNGVKLNPSQFFFDDLGFIELTQKN